MEDDEIPNLTLETPPSAESPAEALGDLFSDESIVMGASRLCVAETLLKLLVNECSFTDFMRDVLLTLMKVVKCEAGSILELDPTHNVLFFRAVVGSSSDKITDFKIPMGQGIVGHVAESRQPMIVTSVSQNKAHLKSIEKAVGFEARNLIAVPVIVRGNIFGVIELLNRVGEETFTNADLELISACADLTAKAVEVRLMLAWAIQRASGGTGSASSGTEEAA